MRCDGRFCSGAQARTNERRRTAKSCGPGAATLALSLWSNSQVTVTTSPLHRGERDISRKAIAQGMSECFRSPVCSCAPTVQFLAHETAGAARTRHSLRPLFEGEDKEFEKLGQNMPREREAVFDRHCEERSDATQALVRAAAAISATMVKDGSKRRLPLPAAGHGVPVHAPEYIRRPENAR